VNTGKEKDIKTQGNVDILLSVMNESVPAMLDTFHLHKYLHMAGAVGSVSMLLKVSVWLVQKISVTH